MKKICVLALLMLLAIPVFSEVWNPTMKLVTPEIGFEYGIGEDGHMDLRLGARYNFPPMENLVLGFCFQTGKIMKDDAELYYRDELGHTYDKLDNFHNLSYDILVGWEFIPYGKINPYIQTGIGFVSYNFTATNSVEGVSVDLDVAGAAKKIPIIVGCDFKVWKYIAITPYFKFTGYLDERLAEDSGIEGFLVIYDDQDKEDFNNWRGMTHFGLNLSVPISIPRKSDADGDGVTDKYDFCPGTLPGIRVDERGCPLKPTEVPSYEKIEKELRDKRTFVTNQIYFSFDSADILQESYTLLGYLGKILENHNDWQIEIRGHTDSLGTDSYNRQLSLRRANSVKSYLVSNHRVSSKKLSTKGFGESVPIADNGQQEGRALNRRVEFILLNE